MIVNAYIDKFIKYQPLLYQLVRRDFKAKYKRSVLGILWTIMNPLFTMLILTAVFSTLFRFEIENYPVYLLSGTLMFGFFSEATNMALTSVIGGAAMMKKVNLPKYIFPLARVMSSVVNCFLSLISLLLVMALTKAEFHITIFMIPIAVLYMTVFCIGLGLILSAMMVFFRDTQYLYGLLLTAMNYLTPIFYPESIIPENLKWALNFNPLYYFVTFFRDIAIYGNYPSVAQHVICVSLAVISLVIGLIVFYKKQDRFILYV